MNIGIVGSRRRNTVDDYTRVARVFFALYLHGRDKIVSGGCKKGGDRFARALGKSLENEPLIEHLPDESKLDKHLPPRIAIAKICYARNTLIAMDSNKLIAVVAEDRKGGTEDTIKKFLKKLGMKEPEAVRLGYLILV